MIRLRPFHEEDWGLLLDLANQAVPFAPKENAEWFEYRKAFAESKRTRRHYIATDEGMPVGYGCLEQQSDDPHWLRVYVVCHSLHLSGEAGNRLYAQLHQDAQALRATHLWARELQADAPICEFFRKQGFVETQRFTVADHAPMVVYALDLAG